jgi:hypothetical protein
MAADRSIVTRGVVAARAGGPTLSGAYENLVLVYLVSLLYLYPYGIALNADASIRASDLLGLVCLLVGLTTLLLKQRIRVDLIFLAFVGPFVVLELATPVMGAVAYRNPIDIVSSLRMAILWLPMILLTLLATPIAEPRFESRLRLLFALSLWLNVPYALVQIAVGFGYAPGWMAFTNFLGPWAVEGHFDVVQGLRPAGFFASSTALSVFAIVCLCYFYGNYVATRSAADLRYSLGSLLLVLLTTSRVAFAAAMLIVVVGWCVLPGRRKVLLLTMFVAGAAVFLIVVERTIGLDPAFRRFTRLAESGLLADVSFGGRVLDIWPAALAVAREYPLGTLISAPRVALLIDSGYLTYYIQGRWLYLSSIALLLGGHLVIGLRCLRKPHLRPAGLMILFLAIFLTLAMVVSNPARSPVVIAFLVFAFWKLKTEQASRWVNATARAGSLR